jgi:hypothetical protein
LLLAPVHPTSKDGPGKMTLLEERALRKQRKRLRQQHEQQKHGALALDAPLTALSDDQVLTFLEWCRLNRISERTGRRILAAPGRPVITMLTATRVGIRVGDNRAWQLSRAKVAP